MAGPLAKFVRPDAWRPNMIVRPLLPILLLVFWSLSACESALLRESRAPAAATPVPVAQTTSADPAEVLREFVTAWNRQDFEAMHGLLAERSRELYPQASFVDKYTIAHSELRFGGVDYTPRGRRAARRDSDPALRHKDRVADLRRHD